jgi:hypothetical protein
MKYEKKFQEQQEQLSEAQLQSSQSAQTIHEFATPEDALRFDAKNTAVPEGIAQRLGRSSHRLPPSSQPWWKRLFQ